MDGRCNGCGGCCSNFLPMTAKEIKTIRRYIKKNSVKEFQTLDFYSCPFCDYSRRENHCNIYEVRPEICRGFFCNGEKGKLNHLNQMKPVDVREEFYGNHGRENY